MKQSIIGLVTLLSVLGTTAVYAQKPKYTKDGVVRTNTHDVVNQPAEAPKPADAPPPPAEKPVEVPAVVNQPPITTEPAVLPATTSPGPDKGKENLEVSAAGEKACEDKALSEIYALLMKDERHVLGTLFELTSMRMALRVVERGERTMEALVRKDIADTQKKVSALKNSTEIQAGIKAIYETYGKSDDLHAVNAEMNAMIGKSKKACYWYKSERFANDHASAYLLAMNASEETGMTDIDVATVWTIEKLRKNAAGSSDPRCLAMKKKNPYCLGQAEGNLMNLSTRVARYLGKIEGARDAKADAIKEDIKTNEAALNDAIAKAIEEGKKSMLVCLKALHPACDACVAKAQAAFEASSISFDKIQRGLLKAVAKAEDVKMEEALIGRMGNIEFDLSHFAVGAQGEVGDALSHGITGKKFDKCMDGRNRHGRRH